MNIKNVSNLIVRKALENRQRDFMFRYGDGEDKSPTHSDWNEYGDYSERCTHSDDTANSRTSKHTDHTESYSDYNEYSECNYYHDYDDKYFEVTR